VSSLSFGALAWFGINPGGRTVKEAEQFPGRTEVAYRYGLKLKDKIYRLIQDAGEDEGIFILPVTHPSETSKELIEFAKQHFGSRCVVLSLSGPNKHDWNEIRQVLGEFCDSFFKGLQEDLQQAVKNRGLPEWELAAPYETTPEFGAWALSKAWAFDLTRQLKTRGYTFDPATVEFVVWGGDWSYCSATYPIHMARVMGLSNIWRSFELVDRSCSPILQEATAVEDGAINQWC